MQNRNVYALLVAVGNYEKMNIANLPTYKMDLAMIGTAFENGLRIPFENIRLMAGEDNNGFVTTTDLAHSIADFESKLGSEDIFIFYFSGHGRDRNILFSNGQIELQSVIDYIERLSAKSKLVILDCCYSGNFSGAGARVMHFEECMADFVGKGIAVLASSSADEVSRLGPNGNHSMFTGALSSAITLNKKTNQGRVSLNDIYDGMMHLVKAWNLHNPGKEQQPIFRSSLGGTVYFKVEDYKPYHPQEVYYETEKYKVLKVKPLSSAEMKRLAAFVIVNEKIEKGELATITKEIATHIKYAEVYSGERSEKQYEGMPAKVVWCYFGYDNSDILNGRHFAYTIWASDDDVRDKFFRENRNASVEDDIYVFINSSYDMVRRIQVPSKTRQEFVESNRQFLALIVSMAERFVYDLQEVFNKAVSLEELQEKYGEWIQKVKRKYIELSDEDVAPDDLHDWSEEIMNLAGCVLDMSIILENKNQNGKLGNREIWLIKNSISHYHDGMEKIKQIEDEIDF